MGDGRTKKQNGGKLELAEGHYHSELVGQREKVVLLQPRNIDQLEESRTMTSLSNKN